MVIITLLLLLIVCLILKGFVEENSMHVYTTMNKSDIEQLYREWEAGMLVKDYDIDKI